MTLMFLRTLADLARANGLDPPLLAVAIRLT